MNKVVVFFLIVLGTIVIATTAIARGPMYGNTVSWQGDSDPFTLGSNVMLFQTEPLSSEEEAALLKMREEEKLARDVYLTLRDKWQLLIFDDIAASEQNHTDQIKMLIDKYGLNDPVVDDSVGAFTQEEFSALYTDLVELGSSSIENALKVGATIEDLDINDLNHELAVTDNDDIRVVFNNLKNGSYNHMRAFVGALEAYGSSYTPQYITEDEFNTILSYSQGHGYGHSTSSTTMLPARIKPYSGPEKTAFTLTPELTVAPTYQSEQAELFAVIYLPSLNKWYVFDAPNHLVEWTPGENLAPLSEVELTDSIVEFPLITTPIDLSPFVGTVDVYYGYRPENGNIVYTFSRLIFE